MNSKSIRFLGTTFNGFGDFNGDGRFNTGDLVFALADGGYEQGPVAAVAAVPEPTSLVLTLIGLIGLYAAWRRR